VEKNSQTAL